MAPLDKDELIRSAKDRAKTAIKYYKSRDLGRFYVDAAVSLEHVSKALLVSYNPALLIDLTRKDFDSLLHLCGLGMHARGKSSPKTISATEAVSRVRRILPGLSAREDSIRNLVEVRDGVIHAGFLPNESARDSLVAFLTASNDIYEELGIPAADRWHDQNEFVVSVLHLASSGIEELVRNKLQKCRAAFAHLSASVPPERLAEIVQSRTRVATFVIDEDEAFSRIDCPACGCKANCGGAFDVDWDVDGEWDDGEISYSSSPSVFIYPSRLACPVCGLSLDEPKQLAAAEIPKRWKVPNDAVSHDAFMAHIEGQESDERE